MPSGVSIDSRLKILEKNLKDKDNMTRLDRLMVDYYFTQLEYGFADTTNATKRIAEYVKIFGAKKINQVREKQKEIERSAKDRKLTFGSWYRLAESKQQL